ncbi:hypothetical protein [Streptomyces sp. NPDC018352]|uniref:hypothetical protein n=1 Tax=Streptomyces sp. NPDC018352 TaxID=3157194 RepID=UPI0033F6BDA4
MLADIDGDGRTDRASDPSRTGAQLTVAFGKEAGYGTPVWVRKQVGRSGSEEQDVLAASAEFVGRRVERSGRRGHWADTGETIRSSRPRTS